MDQTVRQNQVIEDFKAGNLRFLSGASIHSSQSSLQKLKEFAKTGQSPKAIVLCCSDSRAPVELIFDQDIGDIFVIRVAGNIVAPSLVGSVEFAATTFGVSLVLVMGHTQCGAVTAALHHIDNPDAQSSANFSAIVNRIKPHIYAIAKVSSWTQTEKLERAIEANVLASVAQLFSSSPMIEELVQKKQLKIIGGILELASGKVNFLDQ